MWDKSPCNCRTMMDQNVILTVFHAWSQIGCVWKIVKTTFPGIIVLQLQGDCPRMNKKFMKPKSNSVTSWIKKSHQCFRAAPTSPKQRKMKIAI